MKTKAAVLYQAHKPLVVEELELDEPKADEVLVKIAYTGLCHSDLHAMDDELPVGLPMVLGHEGSGVVEAVGANVTRIKPGDHVVLTFIPSCGHCRWCVSGMAHLCDLGANITVGPQLDGTYRLHNSDGQDVGQMCMVSTFSQYTVVNQDSVCVIDKNYPLDVACLVGCGVATGVGAVNNRAKVTPGSSVLVIGIGGIGINAVQGAKLANATTIIAADTVQKKLDWAMEFGATHTIDASKEDVVNKVMEITNGVGVDYAFEAIATPATIGQAFNACSKGGTAVVIGLTPAADDSIPISPLILTIYQKAILGTLYGSTNPQTEIPLLLNMHAHGQLKLNELITHVYTLDEINQGYDDLRAGKNLRGIIKMS
jgi:NDMA-dependent alcohol dehydrogenase